jgi:hypothetical protein
MIRQLLAATAALLTFGVASPAAAQITTTIPRPKPNEQAQVAAARREAAAQDSVTRVTLTGMKEWVDSAANALAVRPDTAGAPSVTGVAAPAPPGAQPDTTRSSAQPQQPTPQQPTPQQPEFRDGAPAPDTATPLPTLALAGGALIVLGVLVRRRATAPIRARR